jgi:DNA-binding GntR family transcriptional regulator
MSQPLAQQATGKIIEMVLSGTLMPGDGLQEAKLGEMLDMSRTPVCKAIKRIEADGLAVQDGRFLKVRALTAAEVEETFFLRGVLEAHCARQATSLPVAVLDELEARIRRLQLHGPGASLPHRFLKSCEEHLEMLDALRAGDCDRAGVLMAEHITHPRDVILKRLALSLERNGQ